VKIKYLLLALAGFCALQPALRVAQSCSVPVFRYALERWRPDPYKGIFIYRDKISDGDRALLDQLKEAASNDVAPLNLIIREVDTATFSEEKLKEVLQGPVPDVLPLLIVWYPDQMGKKPPVWKEKLTPSLVEAMLQSPKRQQLAINLINGESVVWVFIPSGNRKKDEAAKALIQRELDGAMATFTKTPFTILSGAKLKKLPYGFPILTLSPDDPKERVFVETLLKSEPDLYEHTDEPMVFPVFGRGRILGCLFGEYITAQHIQQTTAFLAGSCSCEVKNQNPGLDLLVAAPWDMVVMDAFVEDTPLPELTGVMPASIEEPTSAVAPADTGSEEAATAASAVLGEAVAAAPSADPEDDPAGRGNSELLKIYGITLSSALVVVLFAGFILSQRRKKDS
jgi:hypothetical protein